MRLAACLLILGIVLYRFFSPHFEFDYKKSIAGIVPPRGGRVICEGVVDGNQYESAITRKIILNDLWCRDGERMNPVTGKIRLTTGKPVWFFEKHLKEGDVVRFSSSIRMPSDFKNFNKGTLESYCFANGILTVGYVKPDWIIKIGRESGRFQSLISGWRDKVKGAAVKGMGDGPEYQIVRALVLGDKSGFSRDMMEDFKSLGIIHLLVVSGLHVAMLAAISWWLVLFFGLLVSALAGQRDMRTAASIISLILIWLFIALTGFGTPAVRAGLITTVYLGSIILKRPHDSWDCLALSAIIILIVSPRALFDISFQLTYAAVCGILVASKFMIRKRGDEKWPMRLSAIIGNMLIVSLGASVGVFPLLAYHFGKIPALSPLLSILFSPIVTIVIVPVALIAALATPVSAYAGAGLFALLTRPVRSFLWLSTRFAEGLSWSAFGVNIGLNTVFVIYGVIIAILCWKRSRIYALLPLLPAILLITGYIMTYPLERTEGKLAVTFLDVGQGAAVVVRLPDGVTILIDGGGVKGSNLDLGKSVLEPFLKKIGVEKVDSLIVTHPHPDHFKGLAHIAEVFGPKTCMIGSYPENNLGEAEQSEWSTFLGRIERAGVSLDALSPKIWSSAGVNFKVYSPPEEIPEGWSVNDASIVTRIEFGDVSFLITGDIESAAERYLLDYESDLGSTVLQVPHHGSSTSSSALFLDEVSPSYGVIQVGAFNKFGFPNEDVMARLEERSIKLHRTDRDGAITFITDGDQLKVFSAVSR